MDRGLALEALEETDSRLLRPYVPTFVADWLQEREEERYRAVDCTLVFADISGFTRMTEMLAGQGKAGAEEMAGLINSTFRPLLEAAYAYGAGLIKWGGDATLLLFHGDDHASRACRAAGEMQRAMRQLGTRQTSRGPLRLRMSIGASSGTCDFFLVGGDDHRELLVLGEVATVLTQMEKVADAGQIVVSPATVAELVRSGERAPTVRAGDGWLLRGLPSASTGGFEYGERDPRLLSKALSPILRESILADALESEHRYVTVGFVKFTDTDRLIAAKDHQFVAEAVEHVLQAAQSAAAENDVTLLATDIGPDCGKIMLCAGAPRRVGRDEERMVATLRAIVSAGGPLPISAGATAGRAFSGDYGPSYRRTYSLMGDCVNLAARLMAHAPDGELLASGGLVQVVGGKFAAEPRPPFAAKGKRLPVHPFSLGEPVAHTETAAAEDSPLIGRERELTLLQEAAGAAARGAGRVIDLVGEPGMGKSRLLSELRARTAATAIWTQGEVYAGSRPYAPVERLIRQVCGLAPRAPEAEVTERLTVLIHEYAPELIPWLPLIGVAAGLELRATPEVEQTDASLRKQRLEQLTSEFLGRVLDGPILFVLNDVHLMDDASRDLIRRLAQDTADRPWLLVTSRRPDTDSLLDGVAAERLDLGPLSAAAAAELLARATAKSPLPPERLARLAERAAGNPLFLQELSAQLSQGGDLETLPSSVEEAIAARIDRLDPADRRILRAAAVLGMDVDIRLLAEMLAPDASRLPRGVTVAALGDFLEPVSVSRHRFSHQLIREVAYQALPYGRRSDLHARTADAIRAEAGDTTDLHAELLSMHCFHGGQYQDAWHFSLLAAERARSRYANVEAADSYRRAIATAARLKDADPTAVAEVEEALGDLCLDLGEPEEAETAIRRGLRRVRDRPLVAARLQIKMARVRESFGQFRAGLQWTARAERTLADVEGPEASALRATVAGWRARLTFRLGRFAETHTHAEVAIALARETGDLMTLAQALELADASALELGRPSTEDVERALAIYEELGSLRDQARVLNSLGVIHHNMGAWAEALEAWEAAERAYVRSGATWVAVGPAANRAEILSDQGRLEEAEAEFERAMQVWRGVNAASFIAYGDYQLGRIAARQGRQDEAVRRLEAARGQLETSGEVGEILIVDAFTAEARCLAGRYEEALSLADDTLKRASLSDGVSLVEPLLQRVRGMALLALGRQEAGEAALRRGLEAARARQAGHEIAFALRTLIDAGLADGRERHDWEEEVTILASALGLGFAEADLAAPHTRSASPASGAPGGAPDLEHQ